MAIRDVFLKIMRRQSEGYVPRYISLCPSQRARFVQVFGHEDYAREWNLPGKRFCLPFHAQADDFSDWHTDLDAETRIDRWGIGHRRDPGGLHFESLLHPLTNVDSVASVEDYPFPAPATVGDGANIAAKVEAAKADGHVAIGLVAPVGGTVFWPAYKLRGMENLLCDLYANEALATALLDRITGIVVQQARMTAATGVDLIHIADDLGTQTSTYMSPDAFRTWFKPRLAQVIAAAKAVNPDVLVHFHSDGAVQTLIPDFIEIGIDILNPVQPECMDPLAIKADFGDKLSFSGCLGTQTTMPFGSPHDVRRDVERYCEHMGRGGGFWIGPTHLIEPEVPWENVMAFIEATEVHTHVESMIPCGA